MAELLLPKVYLGTYDFLVSGPAADGPDGIGGGDFGAGRTISLLVSFAGASVEVLIEAIIGASISGIVGVVGQVIGDKRKGLHGRTVQCQLTSV